MSSIKPPETTPAPTQTSEQLTSKSEDKAAPAKLSRSALKRQNQKSKAASKQPAAVEPPPSEGLRLINAMTIKPSGELSAPRARAQSIAQFQIPGVPTSVERFKNTVTFKTTPVPIFQGDDHRITGVMEDLIVKHGRPCHIGFFDNSYSVYAQQDKKVTLPRFGGHPA